MTKQLVLDTSLFVNPASAAAMGASPTDAFSNFLELAKKCEGVSLFMPPSIYRELMHFAEEPKILPSLLTLVQQRAPQKHSLQVPGFFIYALVESFRDRVDRGLRLAERHVRDALQTPAPQPVTQPTDKPADQPASRLAGKPAPGEVRADSKLVSSLRESFRRMMREGMLDSKADVDLLLLAYEIKGTLVSADEGVLAWAENLGIEILPYAQLVPLLKNAVPSK